jgi:hypothetical protein
LAIDIDGAHARERVVTEAGNPADTLPQRRFEGRGAAQRRVQAQDIQALSARIDDDATFTKSVHKWLSCRDERFRNRNFHNCVDRPAPC